MTSAWQSCQGDYKPLEVFERGNQTVIARNIKKIDEGLYQWEEYAMLTEDYNAIQVVVAESEPYTETKTAYYGEKEKTFYEVPEGNVAVFFANNNKDYSVKRIADRITVSFEALTEKTDITITVN